ncbi:uncharacterized protein, partial [Diabrotica undecimpunctata]|uniref:uncharacterized protein n=1 Tax=Diabrotica undecimpunctata TaxID=50387 RepID=UPI003B63B148
AFVITADIEKMYRQVMINPKERSLQRIFWRSNPNEELEIDELNTVTYGTASAPFLAIRCIMELALNCEGNSPDLSQIIKNDIYVDDLITGADSIQEALWLERLSWDESVPQPLHGEWLKFKSEIPKLNSLIIPRHVTLPNVRSIELHGFSDASERAYGACIYVRSITRTNQVSVRLLCAKSKVSPLKTITIPKLELCAAVVLSKLCTIKDALNNTTFERVTLWTDSTIVLGWLKTEPHRLKTFTSNRVAEVQTLTSSCDWRHVSSKRAISE